MGEVAVRLERHHEALRGPGAPVGEGLRAWQPVERAVVLDRGVPARVGLQPAALRHAGRIQHAPPVAGLPAGSTPENKHSPISLPAPSEDSLSNPLKPWAPSPPHAAPATATSSRPT